VRQVRLTILLGTSTAHGAFTREVIEIMSAGVERPIVFPISNPTSRIEAKPTSASTRFSRSARAMIFSSGWPPRPSS